MIISAGSNSSAGYRGGVAIGYNCATYSGVAIHGRAERTTDDGGKIISAGNGTAINGNVSATGGVAVGGNVQAGANSSVAIGAGSRAGQNAGFSVAVGAVARANDPNSIVIGSRADSHGENTFTIGCGVKSPEQIYLGDTTLKDAIGEMSGTVGPKGDKGDKGDPGEKGEKGEKGDKGDSADLPEFKTINGESIIGSGNIEITAGGSISVDAELSADSTNPVQNKVITNRINELNAAIPTDNISLVNGAGYISDENLGACFLLPDTLSASEMTSADFCTLAKNVLDINRTYRGVARLTDVYQSMSQFECSACKIMSEGRPVLNVWLTTTQTDDFLKPYVWFTSCLDGNFTKWTRFADKDDIPVVPTVVSAFTNDSGYLTEHQSLEDYYTKSQVDSSINTVKESIPTKNSQLKNDSDYVTGEMMKEVINTIPVNVSQLNNDAGYLTEHQSLKEYYTKSQVDSSINAVKKSIPVNVSQLNNDSNYLTHDYASATFATTEYVDGSVNDVKKTIPTNTSQLNNDSGYLTEHQSLEDYYTKSQVDSSINAVKKSIPTKTSQLNNDSGYLTEHQSLEDYYTKEQTDSRIDGKIAARTEDDPIFTAWKNGTEITAGKSATTVADSSYGTAIGQYSQAGTHATALGSAAKATGQYAAAIGNGSKASDADSVSIGRSVTSHGSNTFNIRPTKLENIYLGDNTLKSITDTLYTGVKTSSSSSGSAVALSADKFVTISPSTSLNLTFADTDWQTNCKEYSCAVVCGGTITLSVPEGVKWNGSAPSMTAGKTYLMSFFNGYCAWGEF